MSASILRFHPLSAHARAHARPPHTLLGRASHRATPVQARMSTTPVTVTPRLRSTSGSSQKSSSGNAITDDGLVTQPKQTSGVSAENSSSLDTSSSSKRADDNNATSTTTAAAAATTTTTAAVTSTAAAKAKPQNNRRPSRKNAPNDDENENQQPRTPQTLIQLAVAAVLRLCAMPVLLLTRFMHTTAHSRMHPFARFVVQAAALASVIGATAALPKIVTGKPPVATSRRNVAPKAVPYSTLMHLARQGRVEAAVFDAASDRVTFRAYASLRERADAHKALAARLEYALRIEEQKVRGSVDGASNTALERVVNNYMSWARSNQGASPQVPSAPQPPPPPPPLPKPATVYSTRRLPGDVDANLLATLSKEYPRRSVGPASVSVATPTFARSLGKALSYALLLWLPLMPLFFIMRNMTRNMGDRNGTNARRNNGTKAADGAVDTVPQQTFADVAGCEQAKAELAEVVACLRSDDEAYAGLEHLIPHGVLLAGPPGTGKTLLARSVAGEAGVAFFSISASEFVEMFVGRGAARVRSLFAEARRSAPAVVFIDEIDAVGGKRGRGLNDERDQTLNQLLTELDGFDTSDKRVVVLAATNRADFLDSALTRSGRFSRKVYVELPTRSDREQIAALHLKRVPLADDVGALSYLLADLTSGCSGADLAAVVSDAALLSARRVRSSSSPSPPSSSSSEDESPSKSSAPPRGVTFSDVREACLRLRRGVDGRGGADAPWFRRGWLPQDNSPNNSNMPNFTTL